MVTRFEEGRMHERAMSPGGRRMATYVTVGRMSGSRRM